jgi:hypothetical protein
MHHLPPPLLLQQQQQHLLLLLLLLLLFLAILQLSINSLLSSGFIAGLTPQAVIGCHKHRPAYGSVTVQSKSGEAHGPMHWMRSYHGRVYGPLFAFGDGRTAGALSPAYATGGACTPPHPLLARFSASRFRSRSRRRPHTRRSDEILDAITAPPCGPALTVPLRSLALRR